MHTRVSVRVSRTTPLLPFPLSLHSTSAWESTCWPFKVAVESRESSHDSVNHHRYIVFTKSARGSNFRKKVPHYVIESSMFDSTCCRSGGDPARTGELIQEFICVIYCPFACFRLVCYLFLDGLSHETRLPPLEARPLLTVVYGISDSEGNLVKAPKRAFYETILRSNESKTQRERREA